MKLNCFTQRVNMVDPNEIYIINLLADKRVFISLTVMDSKKWTWCTRPQWIVFPASVLSFGTLNWKPIWVNCSNILNYTYLENGKIPTNEGIDSYEGCCWTLGTIAMVTGSSSVHNSHNYKALKIHSHRSTYDGLCTEWWLFAKCTGIVITKYTA